MVRTASSLFLAAALAAVSLPALAQDAAGGRRPHIIVTGEGEHAMRPDTAILTFGVMREAETAQAAMQANNEAMTAVTQALKEAGIEDRDLQTAGIQINPRYEYPRDDQGGQTAQLVGYQVTNTLTVRVRDISKAGAILDRSVSLGVNQGGGISFVNEDPSGALSEARKKAVADAVEKARTLAEAAGVQLGAVARIAERTGSLQPPQPFMAKAAADMRESVPLEPGENAYRVEVEMTFGIKGRK